MLHAAKPCDQQTTRCDSGRGKLATRADAQKASVDKLAAERELRRRARDIITDEIEAQS